MACLMGGLHAQVIIFYLLTCKTLLLFSVLTHFGITLLKAASCEIILKLVDKDKGSVVDWVRDPSQESLCR